MDQSRTSHVIVRTIPRTDWPTLLTEMAKLRILVFREFPYLYAGSEAYESNYLRTYFNARGAGVMGAFDGEQLIGMATALPLEEAEEDFRSPLIQSGYPIQQIFYFGESVLRPEYRGRGIGKQFFDLREAHARAICPSLRYTSFCAVNREANDSRKPENYRTLDGFWKSRGYQKHEHIQARFKWPEVGSSQESEQTLSYWIKDWKL